MIQEVFGQGEYPFSIMTVPPILAIKWHYKKTVLYHWEDTQSYDDMLFLVPEWTILEKPLI